MPSFRVSRVAVAAWSLALAGFSCSETATAPPISRLPGAAFAATTAPAAGTTIVLHGTVLTPDGVLTRGYVGIADGRITSVSTTRPDAPDAGWVNTDGIIL